MIRGIVKSIDWLNETAGSLTQWLVPLLVLQITFEVTARYLFNSPTIWGFQTSTMIGGSIIVLSWGYCQLRHAHIRIDILYARYHPKLRLVIDLIGSIVCFFPLYCALIKTSFEWALRAWQTHEVMPATIWYPPSGPIRTILLVGLVMVFLQFFAQFLRDINELRGGDPL